MCTFTISKLLTSDEIRSDLLRRATGTVEIAKLAVEAGGSSLIFSMVCHTRYFRTVH
jgi:hypothetical protein